MSIKKYISIIFLFVLFIPAMDKLFTISDRFFVYKSNEKRALAKMPEIDITNLDAFPKPCEDYLNDHFMCRNFLIKQYSRIRLKLYKQSPIPTKVYIGLDDWLYFNSYDYKMNHKTELSEEQLNGFLNEFKRRRDFLKQQNCSMYIYVIPSKIQVYPEYAGRNVPNEPDQGAALEAYIQKNSDLSITYLLPTFLKEKKKDAPFLFLTTDNHWSHYGAFITYSIIMKDLKKQFPSLQPLTMNDMVSNDSVSNGGNLAVMMDAESDFKEHHHAIKVAKPHAYKGERKGYPFIGDFDKVQFERQFYTDNKNLPSALFIGESFSEAMIPYLTENFSHTTFIFDIWRYQLHKNIVEGEKPAVLVYVIHEPLLLNLLDNAKEDE